MGWRAGSGTAAYYDGTDLRVVPAADSPCGGSLLSVTTQSRAVAWAVNEPKIRRRCRGVETEVVTKERHTNMAGADPGADQLADQLAPMFFIFW